MWDVVICLEFVAILLVAVMVMVEVGQKGLIVALLVGVTFIGIVHVALFLAHNRSFLSSLCLLVQWSDTVRVSPG